MATSEEDNNNEEDLKPSEIEELYQDEVLEAIKDDGKSGDPDQKPKTKKRTRNFARLRDG